MNMVNNIPAEYQYVNNVRIQVPLCVHFLNFFFLTLRDEDTSVIYISIFRYYIRQEHWLRNFSSVIIIFQNQVWTQITTTTQQRQENIWK